MSSWGWAAGLLVLFLALVVVVVVPWRWHPHAPCFSLQHRLEDEWIKHKHATLHRPLDRAQAHDNLRVFGEACDGQGVEFWLSEGTALGVVRDGDFIPWDDDVDVSIWAKDAKRFRHTVVPELRRRGFVFSHGRQNFLSFFRRGEKLDVSVMDRGRCEAGRADCTQLFPHVRHFRTVDLPSGYKVKVPASSDFLVYLYGPHWRTPQRGSAGKSNFGDRGAGDGR